MAHLVEVRNWLQQSGFVETESGVFEQNATRYVLHDDHFCWYGRDATQRWLLLEITTYVDLFPTTDGALLHKWEFIANQHDRLPLS